MSFDDSATNFVILMVAAISLLVADFAFWLKGRKTFSETLWSINQKSLALAFIIGLVAGHVLTVPG